MNKLEKQNKQLVINSTDLANDLAKGLGISPDDAEMKDVHALASQFVEFGNYAYTAVLREFASLIKEGMEFILETVEFAEA